MKHAPQTICPYCGGGGWILASYEDHNTGITTTRTFLCGCPGMTRAQAHEPTNGFIREDGSHVRLVHGGLLAWEAQRAGEGSQETTQAGNQS